jgi:predicted transcriptional regulator
LNKEKWNITIDKELKKDLQRIAVEKETKPSFLIEDLVREYVEQEKKKGTI